MTETNKPDLVRLTPYELVFGDEMFETSLFPDIRQEIDAREQAPPPPPERFLFLTTVGKLLRIIAGAEPPGRGAPATERRPGSRQAARMAEAEDPTAGAGEGLPSDEAQDTAGGVDDPAAGPDDAAGDAAEALDEYGALLFQGYQFWRHGHQFFVMDEALARELLEHDDGVGDDVLRPLHPAGYLQLPRNLLWAQAGAEQTPEPVDGVFWTLQEQDDDARLDVLLVLGMRPDRPGFSVVPVSAELEGGRPGAWAQDARPGGRDFENVLPGGELDALYAVTTPAEALKLVALWFRRVERSPESLGGVERNPEDAAPDTPHGLPPSILQFRRVEG